MLAEFLITNVILASGLIIALVVCCLFGTNPECSVWFYLGAFASNNSHIILSAFKMSGKESGGTSANSSTTPASKQASTD